MILWTIQPAELYDQIIREGYYHFDESWISDDAWIYCCQDAYDWLVEEMKKRIGDPPVGVKYPVWAWYVHDSKRKKPDLRKMGLSVRGEQSVCLEIDIPDDEVVLSDEELWHFVLGNSYMYTATCQEDLNKEDEWFNSLAEDKKRVAIVKSWQNIFDIEPFDNGFEIKGRYVQATFWELKAEQIRKIWFFKAK